MILEIALVEVVPNKAELGALGLAATGEVVAMFADREAGKFGPINLRRATWYGHAHKIIEEWAEQFVEIVNAPPGEKVKDTATFTLLPW